MTGMSTCSSEAARGVSTLESPHSFASTVEVLVNLNAADYLIERHLLPSRLSANLAPAERLVMSALRP